MLHFSPLSSYFKTFYTFHSEYDVITICNGFAYLFNISPLHLLLNNVQFFQFTSKQKQKC